MAASFFPFPYLEGKSYVFCYFYCSLTESSIKLRLWREENAKNLILSNEKDITQVRISLQISRFSMYRISNGNCAKIFIHELLLGHLLEKCIFHPT